MLGAHENEEHRHVCSFTDTISVEVGADAHAVAVRTGVKGRGVEADCATVERIAIPPTDVRNLPDEDSVGSLDIEDVLSQTDFVDHDRVLCKTLLHRLEVLADFEELRLVALHFLSHDTHHRCVRPSARGHLGAESFERTGHVARLGSVWWQLGGLQRSHVRVFCDGTVCFDKLTAG